MTTRSGFWTAEENLNFERGVILHGWSSWTMIHKSCVTTRKPDQIKSHAQKIPREEKERLITAHREKNPSAPSPHKKPSAKARRASAPLKKRAPRRTSCTEALERSTNISSDEKGDVEDSFGQNSLISNAKIVKLVSNVDEANTEAESIAVFSQGQRSSSPEHWKAMLDTNFEMTKSSTHPPKNEDDLAHSEGEVSPSLPSERVSEASDELLPEYTKPSDDESLADTSGESVPLSSTTRNSGSDLLTDACGLLYDIDGLPPALAPSVAVIRARITVDKSIYERIVRELSAAPDYNNKLEYTVFGCSARTPKSRESLLRIRLNLMMKQHEGLRWWCPGVIIEEAHFKFCLNHIIAMICAMHDHPTWSAVSSGGTANAIFDDGDEICEVGHRMLGLFRRVRRGLAEDGYAKLGKCGRETCEDIASVVDFIERLFLLSCAPSSCRE